MPEFDPDQILRDAQLNLANGLDLDQGSEINRQGQQALKRLIDELLTRDLRAMKTGEMFKAVQSLVKGLDEYYRLTQFAHGKADSRPELLAAPPDLLKSLKDWQLRQLTEWLQENEAAHGPP